ncbi:MAG: TerB family tellurite resistance protein [Flavobacteriales bacterium]|nr:TerB family tellurite resistance protein [Flavobacteriales bacterium]
MEAQLFYKELGRLLYAIAAADGKVSDNEVRALKRIVSEQLVPQEASTDHFGTDQAYITEFEFEVLADRNATSEEAFDSFIAYMSRHKNDLEKERKQLIYRSADAVANAFHGVGKAELPLLIELHKHLH